MGMILTASAFLWVAGTILHSVCPARVSVVFRGRHWARHWGWNWAWGTRVSPEAALPPGPPSLTRSGVWNRGSHLASSSSWLLAPALFSQLWGRRSPVSWRRPPWSPAGPTHDASQWGHPPVSACSPCLLPGPRSAPPPHTPWGSWRRAPRLRRHTSWCEREPDSLGRDAGRPAVMTPGLEETPLLGPACLGKAQGTAARVLRLRLSDRGLGARPSLSGEGPGDGCPRARAPSEWPGPWPQMALQTAGERPGGQPQRPPLLDQSSAHLATSRPGLSLLPAVYPLPPQAIPACFLSFPTEARRTSEGKGWPGPRKLRAKAPRCPGLRTQVTRWVQGFLLDSMTLELRIWCPGIQAKSNPCHFLSERLAWLKYRWKDAPANGRRTGWLRALSGTELFITWPSGSLHWVPCRCVKVSRRERETILYFCKSSMCWI